MELPLVQRPRTDRVPVVRSVSYEILTRLEVEEPDGEARRGKAALLNISQGGMLLINTQYYSLGLCSVAVVAQPLSSATVEAV